MTTKLTEALIAATKKPVSGRIELSDALRKGLRFRMTSAGAATWLYQKTIKGGVRRGFTLGSYPAMSLKDARAEALVIELEADRGIDRILVAQEAATKAAEAAASMHTTGDILAMYIIMHIDRNLKPGQSRTERQTQLRTYLKPFSSRNISSVKRSELQKIVDAKAAEGKVVMANRLRSAICAFFAWAHGRGHIEANPAETLQRAGKETSRQRTPTLEEVAQMWEASYDQGDLWGPFFRLCILTGQRSRKDVLEMEWKWVNFEKSRYEIPVPKNGLPHIAHLCAEAIAELRALKERQTPASPFVFSTTGKTASSGVTKAKQRFDAAINEIRAKKKQKPIEHWVLHDLRRSQATALAEAGFDEGVVDRIQNHVAGGSRASAVAAVYNKAEKLPERARALDAWADMVMGRRGQVVQISDARAASN